MFPLDTTRFPSSADELQRLLNESIQRLVFTATNPVRIRDKIFPHLEEIRLSLDGARLRPNPPRPSSICGTASPALQVDQFALTAYPIVVGSAAIDLDLAANNVGFIQGEDSNQNVALAIENATDGKFEVSITHADLEVLVSELVQNQASKQGITVEKTKVQLQQNDEHSVEAQIQLRIRKMFVSASLSITGRLELDDQLSLKVSRLNCSGDGAMATIACSILNPYLRKLEAQQVSLMVLPLGEIRLHDVRLTIAEKIRITAKFGSTPRGVSSKPSLSSQGF